MEHEHTIPIVRLTVDSMRLNMLQALSDMGETTRVAIEQAVERFDFASELDRMLTIELREALQRAASLAAAEVCRDKAVRDRMCEVAKNIMLRHIGGNDEGAE